LNRKDPSTLWDIKLSGPTSGSRPGKTELKEKFASTNWMISFFGLIYSLLILDQVRAKNKMILKTFGDEYQA